MKYTSAQVNSMSWTKWNQTMIDELTAAGFKDRGFNQETQSWEDDFQPYTATDDPKFFILGTLNKSNEIEYLKSLGLLNNGRCPMCGEKIEGNPGRFTSGYDPNVHFQICQTCVQKGRKTSINPVNKTGCIVALFLIPWNLIKSVFTSIFG